MRTYWLAAGLLGVAAVIALAVWAIDADMEPVPVARDPAGKSALEGGSIPAQEPGKNGAPARPGQRAALPASATPMAPLSSPELSAPATPSPEPALPAESTLLVDDTIAMDCAVGVLGDDARIADLIDRMRADAASQPGAEAMRAAVLEAYREAIAQSGGGAGITGLACGLRLCVIELELPPDPADDEIRDAFVARLLGPMSLVSIRLMLPSVDGEPRVARRIFATSPAVTRATRTGGACPD